MTENVESRILEHLKRFQTEQTGMRGQLTDVVTRLASPRSQQ
jgi:hypothetical protein